MNLLLRLWVLFFGLVQYVYLYLVSLIYSEKPAKFVPPTDEPILKLSATALAQKVRERKVRKLPPNNKIIFRNTYLGCTYL